MGEVVVEVREVGFGGGGLEFNLWDTHYHSV